MKDPILYTIVGFLVLIGLYATANLLTLNTACAHDTCNGKDLTIAEHKENNFQLNERLYDYKFFNWIKKAECATKDCDPLCHIPSRKKDPGFVTCGGVAVTRNPQFFANILNDMNKACKGAYTNNLAIPGVKVRKRMECKNFTTLDQHIKDWYWENFTKHFAKCSTKAFIHLSDAGINMGNKAAVKVFQRSQNLHDDGILGPNTLKACITSFNTFKFNQARLKYYKSLKTWKYNGTGWTKRLERLDEFDFSVPVNKLKQRKLKKQGKADKASLTSIPSAKEDHQPSPDIKKPTAKKKTAREKLENFWNKQ